MKFLFSIALFSITILFIMSACAPNAIPTPSVTKPTTPAPATPPTSNLSLPTSQDAAWNKIVEAAKKEGKLTTYSYNLVGDIGLAVSKTFKERYGLDLEIITGRGAEFIERLKTEKRMGKLVGDVSDGNPTFIRMMKKEELTTPTAKDLIVLRDKDVWVADIVSDPKDGHLLTFTFSMVTTFVNTKLVKAGEEPKTWQELLSPKWKGNMILTDPSTSAGTYDTFVPLLREKIINADFLKALNGQDLRFSSALPDEAGVLSRGERSLSIRGAVTTYSSFVKQGAPIRAIALNDTAVLAPLLMASFEGSPHPNSARVFINWFLSAEGQTVYGKAAGISSIRKDVENFLPEGARVTLGRPIVLSAEDSDESAKLFRDRWLLKLWGR